MLGEGRCEKRERCVTIVTFLLFEELISLRVSRRTIGKWMDECLLKKLYRDRNRLCLRTWKSKYCEKEKREREKKKILREFEEKKRKMEAIAG